MNWEANDTAVVTDGFDDKKKMKSIIKEYYKLYQKNALFIESKNLQKFSRKNLAGDIVNLLDSISNQSV